MNFLKRLFGPKPADISNDKTQPSNGIGISATLAAQPKAPVARSEEEINEGAVTDATPIMFGATRQLPPLESVTVKPGKHVLYGVNSDIGMIRSNNQDSLYTFFGSSVSVESQPDFGLFVVADGMGGHHDGERASAIAIRAIAEYMLEKFYLKVMKPLAANEERPLLAEVLSEAVQKANEEVSNAIPEGGTTVTAAAMFADLLYIAHVGDSRAYLITSDGVEQVTRDHSLVQRLIELEQLTPEEAAAHPQRNVLYRAIGQSENLEVDAVTRRLSPGVRLLLCSDGLWNQVNEENLLQIVQSSKTPQEACDRLVRLANDRGGPDNITVVLVQLPG